MRYPKMRAAVSSLLTGSGATHTDLRAQIHEYAFGLAAGQPSPEEVPQALKTYIDKVVLHAYKITDGDVEDLRANGFSEDEIYEVTLVASTGASLARFDLGVAALGTVEAVETETIDAVETVASEETSS